MPGISARSLGGRGEKGCSGELLLELLSTPTSSHTHTHTHGHTCTRESEATFVDCPEEEEDVVARA